MHYLERGLVVASIWFFILAIIPMIWALINYAISYITEITYKELPTIEFSRDTYKFNDDSYVSFVICTTCIIIPIWLPALIILAGCISFYSILYGLRMIYKNSKGGK